MLETPRLYFRPYSHKDYDFYLQIWQDPDMVRYIGSGEVRSKEHLKANFPYWISQSTSQKGVQLMLLRNIGKPIGHAGLVPQTVDGVEEMEVGYWVSKRYWNRGYATEAACLFRDLALTERHYERVVSIIQPQNIASARVAEKTGMKFDRHTVFKGQDVCIYAMSQTDLDKRPR